MAAWVAVACAAGLAASGRSEAQTRANSAADTSTSHSSPQSEAGEPRATTSPDAVPPPARDTGPQTTSSPAAEARSEHARAEKDDGKAKAEGKDKSEKAEGKDKSEKSAKSGAVDRLQLKEATVTGDREQPKVMYIVPWKKSDIGDLSGKPMNSLLDEALAPVDRDEFKREVMYYQAVRADKSQNGAAK
jgi:hypothetical protein